MTPQQAQVALKFLERVTLTPGEINSYTAIHAVITEEAGAQPIQTAVPSQDEQAAE